MDWLELISIGAGMYVLYAAFLLKGKGVLTKGIFVSSKVNPDRIRDREGFISAMFPIAVLMGLALIASGAIGMLIDKTTSFGSLSCWSCCSCSGCAAVKTNSIDRTGKVRRMLLCKVLKVNHGHKGFVGKFSFLWYNLYNRSVVSAILNLQLL